MIGSAVYLVADIGGTNARFALASGNLRKGFVLENTRKLKTADFETLRDAAHAYLESCSDTRLSGGCFAVAGPVGTPEIRLTNTSWSFESTTLKNDLRLPFLMAVNDFAAQARGAVFASGSEREIVFAGSNQSSAPRIVLGPGTGLGLGQLHQDGDDIRIVATEGGHAGFAPRSGLEREIAAYLAQELGFVSWERILSGRGLVNLHRALCAIEGRSWPGYSAEDITFEALAEPRSLARRVVETFWLVLASFAGDAAYITGAKGGVYLSGGITPVIHPLFDAAQFLDRFREHAPMNDFAARIPIYLILSDTPALRGAAALAARYGDRP